MHTAILGASIVSLALIAGAVWGLYGKMTDTVEGFLVAAAGGALIVSVMVELVEPAREASGFAVTAGFVLLGTLVFVGLDRLIDRRMEGAGGFGLLLALTLDGIPENLALGVSLIGAGGFLVAALAGSIFLSNLPEAAGGAREMCDDGRPR